jgi:SAM-dependent methyltransferase
VSSSESAEAWSAVAPGWERRDPYVSAGMRHVTGRLLAVLDPQPGQTVLEVGGGLGEVGRRAAELVGPGGRVILSDRAPAMVDASRRQSADVENVDYRVLDAQSLDLPDESVDAVVGRFVYMLLDDPGAGLAETHRVLRPRGRLAFSVWATPDENPWGSTIGRTLVELGLMERPTPDTPGPFRLADPDRIRSLVTTAGFAEPSIDAVDLGYEYASFDEYWDVTHDIAMSLRDALTRLSDEEADELQSRVAAALSRFEGPDGLTLPGRAWVVGATRAG